MLVEPGHEHEWRPVFARDSAEPFAWLDMNWRGSLDFRGATYPLVLLRVAFGSDGPNHDMLYLVNCEYRQIGPYRIVQHGAASLDEVGTFDKVMLAEPDDALDRAMINHACADKEPVR